MTNHPNRGPRTAASTPTPSDVIEARMAARLTQTEAARVIHCSLRAWQQWEAGDRRMHPAFFELWNLKLHLPQK